MVPFVCPVKSSKLDPNNNILTKTWSVYQFTAPQVVPPLETKGHSRSVTICQQHSRSLNSPSSPPVFQTEVYTILPYLECLPYSLVFNSTHPSRSILNLTAAGRSLSWLVPPTVISPFSKTKTCLLCAAYLALSVLHFFMCFTTPTNYERLLDVKDPTLYPHK